VGELRGAAAEPPHHAHDLGKRRAPSPRQVRQRSGADAELARELSPRELSLHALGVERGVKLLGVEAQNPVRRILGQARGF